jgi:hypothetical protein
LVSIGLSGQSSPPQAVSKDTAVHRVMVFSAVEVKGVIVETASTQVGTVAIKVGDHRVPQAIAPIHAVFFIHLEALFRVSLTAFFAFSTKTLVLSQILFFLSIKRLFFSGAIKFMIVLCSI